MKRNLFLCLALTFINGVSAQTVPNGGFESWQVNNYENPNFFETSNYGKEENIIVQVNAIKTTDAYHGNYAIRLNTIPAGGGTAFAYFANGNPEPSKPATAGGIPYNQKPTGVTFRYKSNIIGTDDALFLCWFKKSGVWIGQYTYSITASQSTYTLFNATFTPALTQTPDTVIVAAASSNVFMNSGYNVGNFLQLDSINFKGVSSQPVTLNGSFEQWQNLVNYKLNGWNTDEIFQRANDSYSGAYALELQTGSKGFGSQYYRVGRAQTSTPFNCPNPCNTPPKGGYPYSLKNDTLVFYYKYLPADPLDSARVFTIFKKTITVPTNTTTVIGGNSAYLTIAASYTIKKIPINLAITPDTMIVMIESSKSSSLGSLVGSDLKIDNMYLKSQMIPISDFITPTVGCVGKPVQLNDNSFNMANAWGWIMPGGNPGSSTQQNPVVTYNSIGIKTITMISSNQFGAGATISKTIAINSLPNVAASSINKPCGASGNAVLTASGATSYLWNTGANSASIAVNPNVSTTYTVMGIMNGCSSFATGSVIIPAPVKPQICIVTTDSLSKNNEVFWDKLAYPMLDSMIIYREVITNTYKRIGAVHKSAVSYFTDTARSIGPANGDPNISTYRYKIQIRDTCGAYGPMSLWHNTVYFTHTGSTFFWTNNYLIEGPMNPVITYSLLVCQNPTVSNLYIPVGSTTGNQNQLNDPFYSIYQATADWRVEAYLGYSCYAQKPSTGSNKSTPVTRSNVVNNRPSAIGIRENSFKKGINVYPNPANKYLAVDFESINIETELKLINALGQVVYAEKTQNDKTIDLSGFSKGIYSLIININGEKNIYRVIVE